MNKSQTQNQIDQTKRNFVKKAAYTAPVIITMAAMPSFASAGSNQPGSKGGKKHRTR